MLQSKLRIEVGAALLLKRYLRIADYVPFLGYRRGLQAILLTDLPAIANPHSTRI